MLTLFAAAALGLAQPAKPPEPEPQPFAIVELFTSEGCSSCPPADDLLHELAADADRSGSRVFPLAFHVDYWDHLGWKDPYGSPEASSRQRQYAKAFPGAGIYTPQMIVNGTDQFVGSDREHAKEVIANALKKPAQIRVRVSASLDKDRVRVEASLPERRPDLELNIALVQRGLTSRVKAGENGGRTLEHDHVVRQLVAAPAESDRIVRDLAVPAGATPASLRVIVYAQERASRRIVGAATAAVSVP